MIESIAVPVSIYIDYYLLFVNLPEKAVKILKVTLFTTVNS